MFCNESDMAVRVRSAEVAARMMADRLVGGRVRIQMLKFLPALFGDAMRDTPSIAVQLLESTSETPELIWTEEMRARLAIVFSHPPVLYHPRSFSGIFGASCRTLHPHPFKDSIFKCRDFFDFWNVVNETLHFFFFPFFEMICCFAGRISDGASRILFLGFF